MRPLGRRLSALALLAPATLAAQQPAAQPPAQQQRAPGAGAPPAGARPGGPGGPGGPGAAARAQVPAGPGQIGGVAFNATSGQAIPSAAVTIRSAADSSLVGGALAKADGTFRIEGLRPGRYTVRLRALGYTPLLKTNVVVTPDNPRIDLGRLALEPAPTQLSGVQVQAEREEVALAPDRNAYSVKDMPATSGGTAVDVLRNVPAVEVDGDNKVSLRGNSSVVVQINGRVTPMRGEQLGNFLAQLPANIVSKVEVVSNPSAKNDPEGMAGIINLVLKQEADLGTSGAFSFGGGSTRQMTANGNLGHQEGRWTFFSSYGFMKDRRTVEGYSTRAIVSSAFPGSLDSDLDGVMRPQSHSATLTAEYKADKVNTFSNNLVLNKRAMGRLNGSFYRDVDGAGAITSRSNQFTDQDQGGLMADYAATWRRTVKPNANQLVVEGRVNHTRDENDVLFTRETLSGTGASTGTPAGLETNETQERSTNAFAQVDWTRELRKGTKLESGYKGTFRHQTSDFDVATGVQGGTLGADLARSNAYTYDEQVNAGYAVLSQNVGKFDLQGGLRLEQAASTFDLRTTNKTYDNDYKSAFPSAIVSYNLDPQRQLKASYSKRIQRPFVQQLNPFGFREDALTVFEGNPRLQPEYTHSYELGYQQSLPRNLGSLQITPYLRHTVNAVRQIGVVDEAGILRISFQNAATSDSYGTDANLTFRAGKLTGFGGASVFENRTDAANLENATSVKAFGWATRANVTWKILPTTDLQAFGSYRAKMKTEQGTQSRFLMTNLAVRHKLRGDKATATLRIMDPLGTMGWTIHASDGRVIQLMDRRFGARGAFLNFSWNFGQAPRLRPRPQEESVPQAGQPGLP
ncbi:TonB-dependent receptor domain-containing protein [Roseisolibacter agri]|uniref:TonB-dependent receptor n=1 Tax=Roseisolibacter agri TaxID=2014610 RepID=A0AA37VBS2_9BACT|nr:TonB-dependent receptor [Roseisolibacter agri]GLC26803.1 TonB-dependent receptor [Roseisolibacter agri]